MKPFSALAVIAVYSTLAFSIHFPLNYKNKIAKGNNVKVTAIVQSR